jgi:hypothetical protein
VRVPVVTGALASIAINAAPQYSVSNPSVTSPFDESVVTSLQTLQSLRASQDVAAHATSINDAANKSFLFIFNEFQFKDSKSLSFTDDFNRKKVIFEKIGSFDASYRQIQSHLISN